jgi:SET domain
MIQDLSLMQKNRDRCRFLSEVANSILIPLHKTEDDPFSGNRPDVDSFGWGFAIASSRALRNPKYVGPNVHAMIPGIDIASHSFQANCEVIDAGSSYILRSLVDISEGSELTIDYGPFSNDDFLSDYGFTIDNNPHDQIMINCDANIINTARDVMGQSNIVDGSYIAGSLPTLSSYGMPTGYKNSVGGIGKATESGSGVNDSSGGDRRVSIGWGSDRLSDQCLHQWQIQWLAAMELYGPRANYTVSIGGGNVDVSKIDPRIWGMLRVLYSQSEQDLLVHGYNPILLARSYGCFTTPATEVHVIRTIIGIVAIILRVYGTELESDILKLANNKVDLEEEEKAFNSVVTVNTEDIIGDVHRQLRSVFGVAPPLSSSPSVRRLQQQKVQQKSSPLSVDMGEGKLAIGNLCDSSRRRSCHGLMA